MWGFMLQASVKGLVGGRGASMVNCVVNLIHFNSIREFIDTT